jgi:hypothetical protein
MYRTKPRPHLISYRFHYQYQEETIRSTQQPPTRCFPTYQPQPTIPKLSTTSVLLPTSKEQHTPLLKMSSFPFNRMEKWYLKQLCDTARNYKADTGRSTTYYRITQYFNGHFYNNAVTGPGATVVQILVEIQADPDKMDYLPGKQYENYSLSSIVPETLSFN